ncbi:hypothetical protein PMAYCL1PPCAC_28798 [Pristionchus mayeri]|uniref:Uncharacterized protein n=1 Tax=Pristionchus mayeri TaxID=1317129 RepID=A0AAN5IAC2_9BILA|nr:hypothetical protein PMAYCL1PPCAC_28798 [Pristionchus mayeri]
MANEGSVLTLTNKSSWPNNSLDTLIFQVDDGTIFYYCTKNGRLHVKWQERTIHAHLPVGFGLKLISSFYPHENSLYFEGNRKIYRAFFVPPDAISISYVRDLLESEKPQRNGLCRREKYVHRICDDPARGGILVDVSEQESLQLRLEGLHRRKTLYNQFTYETFYPSARKMGENAISIMCSGTLYSHRDSSPFIYISCGRNLFTLDTRTLTFLPYLSFGADALIHSIVGVYNGVITLTGKMKGVKEIMTAELPDGYAIRMGCSILRGIGNNSAEGKSRTENRC